MKRAASKVVHVLPKAGPAVAAAGLLVVPVGGDSPALEVYHKLNGTGGSLATALNQMKQRTVPGNQTAEGAKTAMAMVYGGVAAPALAPRVRQLPLIRQANRSFSLKFGRKRYEVL